MVSRLSVITKSGIGSYASIQGILIGIPFATGNYSNLLFGPRIGFDFALGDLFHLGLEASYDRLLRGTARSSAGDAIVPSLGVLDFTIRLGFWF